MHWGRSWLAIFKGGSEDYFSSVDAWRYNGEKLNPGNLRFTKKQTYGNKQKVGLTSKHKKQMYANVS